MPECQVDDFESILRNCVSSLINYKPFVSQDFHLPFSPFFFFPLLFPRLFHFNVGNEFNKKSSTIFFLIVFALLMNFRACQKKIKVISIKLPIFLFFPCAENRLMKSKIIIIIIVLISNGGMSLFLAGGYNELV